MGRLLGYETEEQESTQPQMAQGMAHRRALETAMPLTHGVRVTRRALVNRRATPTTPVPRWKVFNNQLYTYDRMGRPATTSARRLAASLWELQDLPLLVSFSACMCIPNWIPSSQRSIRVESGVLHSQADFVRSPPGYRQHVQTGANGSLRTHPQKLLSNMETASMVDRQRYLPYVLFSGTRKGDVESTTMSQELLKVFNKIRLLEEQHSAELNLSSSLHGELVQAQTRVRELEQPKRSARREVEGLTKKFAEEKMAWKAKEKERIKAAVQMLRKELEDEQAARQKLENANRKLAKELVEAQSATATALQELANERKARQLIEGVCHKLAQETGDNKSEVDVMKVQLQKAREELEEERSMLQHAEVWREERVQMKMSEARLVLEEKSAALDAMRCELESFLRSQRDDPNGVITDDVALREGQILHNVLNAVEESVVTSVSSSDFILDTELCAQAMQNSNPRHVEVEARPLFYAEGIPDAD